jgi:uncharacterized protein YndB with AHSA1/START domain
MTPAFSPEPTESVDVRAITSRRLLTAAPAAVFEAFADPARLARWWGPKGFTNTIHEFDFRPGGAWRFVMHGPDGTDYQNVSEFVEIAKPDSIVFVHHEPMHRFRMTMTFEERALGTELVWRMLFDTAAEADAVRSLVAAANEQNFDRLESALVGERAGRP